MTKWLQYTLTAQVPVSAGRAGEVQNSRAIHEAIPGTAIRGALGSIWWAERSDRAVEFDDLFARQLDVHAASPTDLGGAGGLHEPALIGPSMVRCKYPPDFDDDPAYHDEVTGPYARCLRHGSHCPGSLERGKGWIFDRRIRAASTRSALKDGAAVGQQLFTRRMVKARTVFTGLLSLNDDSSQDAVDWLCRDRTIFVGGQLSTLGRCQWACNPIHNPYPIPGGQTVVLRTLAPTILVDEWGAASLDLKRAILDAAASLDEGVEVEIQPAWIRPITVSGWHGMAGFPKTEDWALEAGATAIVRGASGALKSVLADGLGVRRREGYGVVQLLPADRRPSLTDAPQVLAPTPELSIQSASDQPRALTTQDRLETLLSGLASADQKTVAKGLSDRIRDVIRLRSGGFPSHIIDSRIESTIDLPWARAIVGRPAELRAIFDAPDLSAMLIETQTWGSA